MLFGRRMLSCALGRRRARALAFAALAAPGLSSLGCDSPSDLAVADAEGGTGGAGATSSEAGAGGGGSMLPDEGGTSEAGSAAGAAGGGGAGGAAGDAGPAGALPPPTLDDYWAGNAAFAYESRFQTPSDNGTAYSAYNQNGDVVVVGGDWYLFAREFVAPVPAYCRTDSARTTVRKSSDHGATWSPSTPIVAPVPGTADECAALDGDAAFDPAAKRWDVLYQCLARDGRWNVCHASHMGDDPRAPFDVDSANPVIKNGTLWKSILGAKPALHDEGTPEILGRSGADTLVTFHGIDTASPLHVFRGIAKTRDFRTFTPVNGSPIFGPAACAAWDVPWASPGCYGGGATGSLQVGPTTYSVIEAADRSGGCVVDQNWVFGMIRARDPIAGPWETMPSPSMVFSTKERAAGHSPPCALGYPTLFVDDRGTTHLGVFRSGTGVPTADSDRAQGHFLYALAWNAPLVDYEFREGPGHAFTRSDAVARGDTEAEVRGGSLVPEADDTFAVVFDGMAGSVRAAAASPSFLPEHGVRLDVQMTAGAPPVTGSAFVAGVLYSYWMELYPDGGVCFWAWGGDAPTAHAAACAPGPTLRALPGGSRLYRGRYDGAEVSFEVDGKRLGAAPFAQPLAASAQRFQIGSGGANAAGLYGPLRAVVSSVKVYGRPRGL